MLHFWHKPFKKKEARGWASDACRKNGGMFTGNYAPGQTKAMCPETTRQGLDPKRYARKVKFEVQNLNKNTGFDLRDDDCYDKLVSEINSCTYGGKTIIVSWRFRGVLRCLGGFHRILYSCIHFHRVEPNGC
jgi:hypothetical protein